MEVQIGEKEGEQIVTVKDDLGGSLSVALMDFWHTLTGEKSFNEPFFPPGSFGRTQRFDIPEGVYDVDGTLSTFRHEDVVYAGGEWLEYLENALDWSAMNGPVRLDLTRFDPKVHTRRHHCHK